MPVSRGYPKESATAGVTPTIGVSASASVADSQSQVVLDTSGIENSIGNLVTALTETSKDVISWLLITTGQALVILAGDYKAYFDLSAYSGSILKVAADATAILKVYGDLSIDNSADFRMDNLSNITIKGN